MKRVKTVRKAIKIGASRMASRQQPGVRWTRGWPPVSRAERHGGWAFPRDKEGVKIRDGVGCCDGNACIPVGAFDSCRCPSIIRASLPIPLVFLFLFPFYLAFVVRRPATPNRSTLSRCTRKDHEMFGEVLYVQLVRFLKSKVAAQNVKLQMAISYLEF